MNDLKNPGCKFHADIVPYMYGEMSAAESSAFETHLIDCGVCTDEFAAVSNARYEVYDWKKTEFEPLATPVFTIPYGEAAKGACSNFSGNRSFRSALSAPRNGKAAPEPCRSRVQRRSSLPDRGLPLSSC